MRRIVSMFLILTMCFSIMICAVQPVAADEQTAVESSEKIMEPLRNYLNTAKEDAEASIWIDLVDPADSEIAAEVLQRIPENATEDDYTRIEREVRREFYSALTSSFSEEYLDESCRIHFRSEYTGYIIAEVPVALVLSLAAVEEVEQLDLSVGHNQGFLAPDIFPNRFQDVQLSNWYYKSVLFVSECGLMQGIANNRFAPEETLSRAMAATVLYRLAGEPEAKGSNPFPDVKEGRWYSDAVIWAAGETIIEGYGDGTFGTNDPVTREQLVTLFWRYQGRLAVEADALAGFGDAQSISSWAEDTFVWAVNIGLIQGKPGGILDPKGTITRAEVAQILMNYDEMKD